jgi:parvulin-like peptidyl-prolyl isomerase
MKAIAALFLCLGSAWAQQPIAASIDVPQDSVIAVFDDGSKFTKGDFDMLISAMPAQNQQAAKLNPKAFIQWWAGMRRLARLAEQEKMDQGSPVKQQIEYDRTMLLGQAKLNSVINDTDAVKEQDVVKYYETNKDSYKQVRVKAIYLAYGDEAPKKRSAEEARKKALDVLKQARGGADFVKLVKENSDDETSKDKDGDFAVLRLKDNIPEAILKAAFALKQGEISEPVEQPGGFYLLRADEVTVQPLEKVHDDLFNQLRQEHYAKWLEAHNKATAVQFPNPAFPGDGIPAALKENKQQ